MILTLLVQRRCQVEFVLDGGHGRGRSGLRHMLKLVIVLNGVGSAHSVCRVTGVPHAVLT